MFSVFLVEPASTERRRSNSDLLLDARRPAPPSREEIKRRIKALRSDSVDHLDTLVQGLTRKLASSPGVEVTFARDAEQAVRKVREISGGGAIAVNKSSVVAKELVPGLRAAGLPVLETYYDEWKSFENRFLHPWQLPASRSRPNRASVAITGQFRTIREPSVRTKGSKELTGLLGVNALSAEEGSALILQHSGNIRKVMEQARHLILVAGLDKIVRSLEDALFQTRCMATYGLEPLLMSLRPAEEERTTIDALPFAVPPEETDRHVHLILLDNGRSEILRGRYRELLHCIGCRACTRGCAGCRLTATAGQWSPKEYTQFLVLGRSPFQEFCLQCKTCRTHCPLDIDLPGMILDARAGLASRRPRPLADAVLAKAGTLEKYGSPLSGVANAMAGVRPVRWLAEKVLDVSSKRQLPKLRRKTFAKWYRSGKPER
jgi:L-lactate dehydrogenase complex protein LldF